MEVSIQKDEETIGFPLHSLLRPFQMTIRGWYRGFPVQVRRATRGSVSYGRAANMESYLRMYFEGILVRIPSAPDVSTGEPKPQTRSKCSTRNSGNLSLILPGTGVSNTEWRYADPVPVQILARIPSDSAVGSVDPDRKPVKASGRQGNAGERRTWNRYTLKESCWYTSASTGRRTPQARGRFPAC